MLAALTLAFTLSQAFRTVAAITAPPLQQSLDLTSAQLGQFAGAFHLAFALMQLVVGVSFDTFGVRRTVLTLSPVAIVGAVVVATGDSFPVLLAGQLLIGIGCSPAFVACTVMIAERFAPARFTAISGQILCIGGTGMLLTGTPLAWLIEGYSWRAGFWVLALSSLVAWLIIFATVRDARPTGRAQGDTVGGAFLAFGRLFLLPQTLGIVLLALVTYASFLTLRGLWLGPYLVERFGFDLHRSGNVAMWMSLTSIIGPPLFGAFDPGPQRRRRWLIILTGVAAALFLALAWTEAAAVATTLILVIGLLSGYMVLQYPDTREAYPAHMTGRAISLMTMMMFGGIAVLQWLTGLVASAAPGLGVDPYQATFVAIGGLLVAGALAFALLPGPARGAATPAE